MIRRLFFSFNSLILPALELSYLSVILYVYVYVCFVVFQDLIDFTGIGVELKLSVSSAICIDVCVCVS